MNPDASKILADMADIKGLDSVPWWPLAPGWRIIICVILLIIVIIGFLYLYKKKREASWKAQALNQLENVNSASGLSELIRRIALQKYGREQCASLNGNEWLRWLKEHDPKGFDWEEKGKVLLSAPYAPNSKINRDEMNILIKAIKRWVK